jgi:phosphatidylethanolamine/phosphatidyl-N-methylethanolamine N-methyltransferase
MTKSEPKKDLFTLDDAHFLKRWMKNPLKTGAVMPSSVFLARKMASYIDLSIEGPVIELGPGTGPITEALIEAGVDEARLVLIEFDPGFVKLLRARFPLASVIEGDAYAIAETLNGHLQAKAAAVVSGLPLVTKQDHERISLVNEAFTLMQPDAPFIQFTYAPLSPLPEKMFKTQGSDPVWRNVPPARVFTYRKLS